MGRRYRRFPVADAGADWLREHGLRIGERPLGIVPGGRPYYQVRGRTKNGKSWIAVATLSVIGSLLAGVAEDGDWRGSRRAPKTVIFGRSPNCIAVACPKEPAHEAVPGMWAITDTRIRYVGFASLLEDDERKEQVARVGYEHLPVEPVEAVTYLEVNAVDFERQRDVTRRFFRFKEREATYERFIFRDGSGVDFRTDSVVPLPGSVNGGHTTELNS